MSHDISFTASSQSFDISADSNIRSIVALIRQESTPSSHFKPFGGNQAAYHIGSKSLPLVRLIPVWTLIL